MRSSISERLQTNPWGTAAAAVAWMVAMWLTVLFAYAGTLAITVPPALLATAPLLVPRRLQSIASLLAAVVLAMWAIAGAVLLGLYFFPSAIMLAVAYFRTRARRAVRPWEADRSD